METMLKTTSVKKEYSNSIKKTPKFGVGAILKTCKKIQGKKITGTLSKC